MRRLAARRHFLFLQGPLSPLYRRVGEGLRRAGHRVSRFNFCAGDWMHWHDAGTNAFRGRRKDWPSLIAGFLTREGVTDLVLHGDTRPYHREAVVAAQDRGIAVHVTELGVLRPGFMTHEREGLVTLSRFPDTPDAIRAIGGVSFEQDLSPRFPGSFALEAWQDVSYHLLNVLLWAVFPHHVRHTPQHPIVDYARWLCRLATGPRRRKVAEELQRKVLSNPRSFFLVPLQVEGDYQILAHSPFGTMRSALEHVVASFLRAAPEDVGLVLKTHPLDNGAIDWERELVRIGLPGGIGDRVTVLDGGDLAPLLRRARGCVTVNSTAGLEALRAGTPVKVLAPALYDITGLTDQNPLDRFWREPQGPESDLVEAFVGALAATTQFRGSIHNREGLEVAVQGLTERLLAPALPMPGWCCEPPPRLARARAIGVPL